MGLIKDYADWAQTWTDAPYMYHIYAGMLVTSVCLGNKVWFPFAGKKLSPALWIMLVGRPRLHRKTTCIELAKRVMEQVNPRKIYPDEFRPEKLQEVLSDTPDGAFFIRQPPVNLGRSQNLLIRMFSQPSYEHLNFKEREYRIERPSFSILSEMRRDDIDKYYRGDLVEFLNLFIFCPIRGGTSRNVPLPSRPDIDDVDALAEKFRAIQTIEGEMTLSPEADKEYGKWYKKYCEIMNLPATPYPTMGELPTYLIKIAMLLQISDVAAQKPCPQKHLSIHEDAMTAAVKWADKIHQDITSISLAKNMPAIRQSLSLESNIKKYLQENRKVRKTDLRKRFKVSVVEINNVIGKFLETGHVRVIKDKTWSKRPRIVYKWLDKPVFQVENIIRKEGEK